MPSHDYNMAVMLAENIKIKAEQLIEMYKTAERNDGWTVPTRRHINQLRADVRMNLAKLNLMMPEDGHGPRTPEHT